MNKKLILSILLVYLMHLSCTLISERKFTFYSSGEKIELKNYDIYNSYGVIFISIDEEFYKKNLIDKKIDSIFYISQDTIIKACMIKDSWNDKFCDFNIGVNLNNKLKVDYYKEIKEFRFFIGQEKKVQHILKNEKVKVIKLKNLNF